MFRRYIRTYQLNKVEQLEEIAELIRKTLKNKSYTWIDSYEYRGWRPDSRTGERMEEVKTWYDDKTNPPEYGGFHVNDSYGVWGLMATADSTDRIEFFDNGIEMLLTTPAGKGAWWQIITDDE
jgi:hypothetical protein